MQKTFMPFAIGNRFPMSPYAKLVLQEERLLAASDANEVVEAGQLCEQINRYQGTVSLAS